MYDTLLNKYGINQAGYYVEDLEKSALEHVKLFGSGPFIYMDPVSNIIDYKGTKKELVMQTAYGQYKDIQIELIQVLSEGPDPYRDKGSYGFHHFSIWVDDLEQAISDFQANGFEVAMRFSSGGGLEVAYIDCVEALGHYVEMHAPINGFWDMVKQASVDWDGINPFRKMGSQNSSVFQQAPVEAPCFDGCY